MSVSVQAIRRHAVKSMLGESIDAGMFTSRGLDGDRAFAVLDEDDTVGSAKHPRKWGGLLTCRSVLTPGGGALVTLPDGTVGEAGSPKLDDQLSGLLGRPVRVTDQPPQDARLERAVPEYEGGLPDVLRPTAAVDGTGIAVTASRTAAGTFFDFGPVHLVTTASLARLRRAAPGSDFDPRRFRPNLVVDTGGEEGEEGFVEDGWVGRRLRIGEAVFEGLVPTPRCVVPTLAHDELPADPRAMRVAAREHRVPVFTLGPLTCVGVYLSVVEPGRVRVGDAVRLEAG